MLSERSQTAIMVRELKNTAGRYSISSDGVITNTITGRIMKQHIDSSGYKRVNTKVGGKHIFFAIHRQLAIHFIPNPDNLPQVNHIDGNKLNNSLGNLEWITQKGNLQHAHRTGLIKKPGKGEEAYNSKLKLAQVKEIREKYKGYHRQQTILGREYGVSPSTIAGIVKYRSWVL